jgi:hypothetical protein
VIVVARFDRFARSVSHLLRALEEFSCVFRRSPPAIPIERHHRFRGKASSDRSEATLELKSFPKWMASVKQNAFLLAS